MKFKAPNAHVEFYYRICHYEHLKQSRGTGNYVTHYVQMKTIVLYIKQNMLNSSMEICLEVEAEACK
jgi:hypothetical protein